MVGCPRLGRAGGIPWEALTAEQSSTRSMTPALCLPHTTKTAEEPGAQGHGEAWAGRGQAGEGNRFAHAEIPHRGHPGTPIICTRQRKAYFPQGELSALLDL